MSASGRLLVSRCESCHSRFLPRPGLCPRCGSARIEPLEIPARGLVLAAVELSAPAPGWPNPHRLALVDAAEGVRVLAAVVGDLPAIGQPVTIVRDGEKYLALAETPG